MPICIFLLNVKGNYTLSLPRDNNDNYEIIISTPCTLKFPSLLCMFILGNK